MISNWMHLLTLHIDYGVCCAISVLIKGSTSVDSRIIAIDGIVDNQRIAPCNSLVWIMPFIGRFCAKRAHINYYW